MAGRPHQAGQVGQGEIQSANVDDVSRVSECAMATIEQGLCPVSGTKGKQVDMATVKCLLAVSLSVIQDRQYYFCRDVDCPVVYFAADAAQTFSVQDVRERVYQKNPEDSSVPVCYCFRYTVGDIREAADRAAASRIVDAINAGIHAGQCACDWRNPQGDCCLGNVAALAKKYRPD